jgi:hypothetical protein
MQCGRARTHILTGAKPVPEGTRENVLLTHSISASAEIEKEFMAILKQVTQKHVVFTFRF